MYTPIYVHIYIIYTHTHTKISKVMVVAFLNVRKNYDRKLFWHLKEQTLKLL